MNDEQKNQILAEQDKQKQQIDVKTVLLHYSLIK